MKPNYALIGCGRIAERHAEQMIRTGKLLAVCDTIAERAMEFASKYNCNSYFSLEHLLNTEPAVELVSICTPNGLHASQSIAALNAHKHVLCEKPLCLNPQDGRAMIQAAENANRRIFVVKQNRYNPPVVLLKNLLKEDQLGKIFSFQINGFWNRPHAYYLDTWKGSQDLDGGTLFTQFSHFIDLLYWCLGDIKKVNAITRNYEHPDIAIEDSGVAIIEMLNGATGTLNYTVNSFGKNMEGSFTIFGERGTIKIGGQYLNTLEYQSLNGQTVELTEPMIQANHYGFYQGSMSNHDKVYDNLLIALQDPKHEFASAHDGLKTVEIIRKIYAASGMA
jgi:predicted dehydrogenase